MVKSVKDAIATTPEDGLLYLAYKLTDKVGFFVLNKHLLYVVSNLDGESCQSISTEYLHLNTNIDIHAFAEDQQFKSGKYNIIDFIPTESGYSDVELESFVNLCSAHALYMNGEEFKKFFYSLINIFQIPSEQAYKNLVGLFGELSLIKYVYTSTGKDISAQWHKAGIYGKYDFVFPKINFEVKSTLSDEKIVEIKHSQLFNNDNNFLVVVQLEKNNAGVSTRQLIQELLTANEYCNNYSFAINIEKEKKRISPNDIENEYFSIKNISVFSAKSINPFPTVPDVVSSLSYKIDISEEKPLDVKSIMEDYDV